jgi:hypothetical protein
VRTQRSAYAFALGAWGGIFHWFDTRRAEHRIERGGELGVLVTNQKPESTLWVPKTHPSL